MGPVHPALFLCDLWQLLHITSKRSPNTSQCPSGRNRPRCPRGRGRWRGRLADALGAGSRPPRLRPTASACPGGPRRPWDLRAPTGDPALILTSVRSCQGSRNGARILPAPRSLRATDPACDLHGAPHARSDRTRRGPERTWPHRCCMRTFVRTTPPGAAVDAGAEHARHEAHGAFRVCGANGGRSARAPAARRPGALSGAASSLDPNAPSVQSKCQGPRPAATYPPCSGPRPCGFP